MHEHISLVTMIFSDKNQAKMVSNLSGKDAQTFVDKLNEVRSHNPSFEAVAPWLKPLIFFNKVLDYLAPQMHRRCLRYLYRICGGQALLPRSLEIPLCYDPAENAAFHGGHTDVWKGQHEGREVSIHVYKTLPGDDTERIKRVSCWWCG